MSIRINDRRTDLLIRIVYLLCYREHVIVLLNKRGK